MQQLRWLFLSIFAVLVCYNGALADNETVQLTEQEQAWIDQDHIVRVRIGNWPPFLIDQDGLKGISVDYLKEIFERNSINYELISSKPYPWKDSLNHIREHKVFDLIPTAKITEERKKHFLFTNEYLHLPWVIFAREDSDFIGGLEDLSGKKVCVPDGYVMHSLLKKNYPSITLQSITGDSLVPRCLEKLALGEVDGYVGNLAVGSYIITTKGYTNLKVAAPTPFGPHDQAMIVRSDWPELASIINKTLESFTPEEHATIRNKWLSVRYEHGISIIDIVRWASLCLGAVLLVGGTIIVWNRRLVKEIEERKRIETELAESERKLSTLIGNLPGMAYRCRNDINWPMEFISDGCLAVTGFASSELLGGSSMEYGDIVHPEDRRFVWEKVQEGVKNNEPFEIEYRITAKNGGIRWVWEKGSTISTADSGITHLEGFIADITQQKELARTIQQSQKIEAIGTLAGGIAHDFNNILSSIIGFTEIALDDAPAGSQLQDNLGEVLEGGIRAKELVKQILASARQVGEERKPIRISLLVEEVLKLIRPTTPTTISIESKLESTAYVMANESQLHQVILNLCTNAIYAMQQEGGELRINLRDIEISPNPASSSSLLPPGTYIELKVTDTGQGIEPEIIGRIFDPYFTTKEVGEGSGMGLAIVNGIIETYKGDIVVNSTPGVTTTFTLRLPVTRSVKSCGPAQQPQLATGAEHILFVDDELPIVKVGSKLLESLGYTVTSCSSSPDALEIFGKKSGEFSLVITDMTMPVLTGDQLALEMRKLDPTIPIIICTGYSNKFSETESKRFRINAFAYKPFTKEDLAKTVRTVLDAAHREKGQERSCLG